MSEPSRTAAPRPLWRVAFACGLAALAASRPAAALLGDERLPENVVELGVGPYRPALSQSPEVVHVRSVVADQGRSWLERHPLQFSALYGRYLTQRLGLFGPYARLGYWRQSAPARNCADPTNPNVWIPCTLDNIDTSTPSLDSTTLNVVPLGVGAIWRIDGLRRARDWPLAFALKAGLDYHLFWSSLGAGLEVLADGTKVRGGVWGLSGAAQVALPLEGLRRRRSAYGSRRAQNPAYLFAEYRFTWAPGLFQRGPRVDLSDFSALAIGIALELP